MAAKSRSELLAHFLLPAYLLAIKLPVLPAPQASNKKTALKFILYERRWHQHQRESVTQKGIAAKTYRRTSSLPVRLSCGACMGLRMHHPRQERSHDEAAAKADSGSGNPQWQFVRNPQYGSQSGRCRVSAFMRAVTIRQQK